MLGLRLAWAHGQSALRSGYSHIIFFMSAYKKQLNRQQSARLDTHAHVENTVIISVGAAVDAFAAILVALPARK